MAAAVGCANAWAQLKESSSRRSSRNGNVCRKGFRVSCVSSAVSDPYKTLQIRPTASESEIKKAFRKLALKYHPDVCRGSNCGVEFQQINEAYDIVLKTLRGEPSGPEVYEYYDEDEQMRGGANDQDWELWEEWMGWEGAGIRDYSSHINPYI